MFIFILSLWAKFAFCSEEAILNLSPDEYYLALDIAMKSRSYKQYLNRTPNNDARYIIFFKTKDEEGGKYWTVLPVKTEYNLGTHEKNLVQLPESEYEQYLKTRVLEKQKEQLIHLQSPLVSSKSIHKDNFANPPNLNTSDFHKCIWNIEVYIEKKANSTADLYFFSLIFTSDKYIYRAFKSFKDLDFFLRSENRGIGEPNFDIDNFASWGISMNLLEKNKVQPQQELTPYMIAPIENKEKKTQMGC